jgi:hypothetical protein
MEVSYWLRRPLVKHILYVLFLCGSIVAAGCQPALSNNPVDTAVTSTTEAVSTPTAEIPRVGDATQMVSTPSDSALQALIEKAKEDLAQRNNISISEIHVVDATEEEWSDSSLGCPQAGMSYLQVITPGYRIALEANGTQYEYHSNKSTLIVFCENPNGVP